MAGGGGGGGKAREARLKVQNSSAGEPSLLCAIVERQLVCLREGHCCSIVAGRVYRDGGGGAWGKWRV